MNKLVKNLPDMIHKNNFLFSFLILWPTLFVAQNEQVFPIEKIQLVADHIIASNSFQYELELVKRKESLEELNYVDFGRTFGFEKPAIAYAITWLNSPVDQSIELELEYNNGVKLFLNDVQIYSDYSEKEAKIKIEERSLKLSKKVTLDLKKGRNKFLIKSETSGKKWVVFLKLHADKNQPTIGLTGTPFISKDLSNISNWLISGPFENKTIDGKRTGLETVYTPELTFEIGKLYNGRDEQVTWSIPRIEILGNAKPINPLWGSYLNYNYHTGGVAWAMMHLAAYTKEQRFNDYAYRYTDFMIATKPFIKYQTEIVNEYKSVNHQMLNLPLLDYTLAPSLPFINRLIQQKDFENREDYEKWIEVITNYALNQQLRSKRKHFIRSTPEVYTTWVDDMFMGLPYLIHAAKLTNDKKLKKQLFDDAASQILSFNKEVWDKQDALYQHAQYSDHKVKMPHWSRANGWGIWAVTEVLKELPKNHRHYKKILKHYQKHVKSIVSYQGADGFWRNVIDSEESLQETSGTAIFVMAIARGINQGWLHKKDYEQVVLNGWKALESVIDADGTVHGICMGTMSSEDVNYYHSRPVVDDDSHGMLGLIMAAIEVQRMIDEK